MSLHKSRRLPGQPAALLALALSTLGISLASADSFEINWDRSGYDYYNYGLNMPREILCQWRCQHDAKCRAWTFINPGVQGPKARCWLKISITKAYPNKYCTSGYIEN